MVCFSQYYNACLILAEEQDASGDWKIEKPEIFDEARVLKKAVEILTSSDCYYDPMQMGEEYWSLLDTR